MLRRSTGSLVRVTSIAETLKPTPGTSQGNCNVRSDISIMCDKDNETKKPVFRSEVYPAKAEHSYLSTMYKWGYNSLTLNHLLGESPGAWSTANDSGTNTDFSQGGDFAAAGLHSGIWVHSRFVGSYNTKPGRLRAWSYGRKVKQPDAKGAPLQNNGGAFKINFGSTLDPKKAQKLLVPHTKEHEKHRRMKNPPLAGFSDLASPALGKRILRECQYHLGQGLRLYMMDGYFGSHPATATSFRTFTDNADHAYMMSMNSVRNKNIMHFDGEHQLCSTAKGSPLDEWVWRRPSVLCYHCPSFDFELPRVVEEFGGPRPQDMGLQPGNPQFQLLEPYSIPMKAMIGALPAGSVLFDTIGFLASRWGFYADDRRLLTLPNTEAAVSANNDQLTVVIGAAGAEVDALRQSPFLYASRHIRIGNGVVSRCWDGTDISAKSASSTTRLDLIDEENGVVHRPLSTRVTASDPSNGGAFSHRFDYKRRNISGVGFKFPHGYNGGDARSNAAAAGMLFGKKKGGESQPTQSKGRPSGFHIGSVKFVVVSEGKKGGSGGAAAAEAAAKAVVESIAKNSTGLYADEEQLVKEFTSTFATAAGLEVVSASDAQSILAKLAKSGSA